MRHFLSEQVFAIRHDAGTHPEGPEGRLVRVGSGQRPGPRPAGLPDEDRRAAGAARLALANTYAHGGSSQGASGLRATGLVRRR